MTQPHPTTPALLLHRRTRRAISLLEIIVSVVILSILASVSYVSYNAVVDRSHDSTATDAIGTMLREANVLATNSGRDVFSSADFKDSVADLTPVSAAAPGVAALELENGWKLGYPGEASDREPGDESPIITHSGDTRTIHVGHHPLRGWEIAGVALRSETGHCAMARASVGQVPEYWVVRRDIGVNCNGWEAANGNTDPEGSTVVATPAPTDIEATPGDTTALVTWTAPVGFGVGDVIGYEAMLTPTGGGNPDPDAGTPSLQVQPTTDTTYSFSGLVNGAEYAVSVRAQYAAGVWSPWGDGGTVVPYTVPDAPEPVNVGPGDAQIGATWSEPAFDGGRPIIRYESRVRLDDETVVGTPGYTAELTRVFSGIPNGLDYRVQVRAQNEAGWGEWATSQLVRPFAAPGVPDNLAAEPGNGQVTLTWDVMDEDPAQPVEGYYLYRDGVIACVNVGRLNTGCDVLGLTNGTQYAFQVSAYYSTLQGAVSGAVYATPRTVPDAPTGVTGVINVLTAIVSYDPIVGVPRNGGAAVEEYRATCTSSDGGTTRVAHVPAGSISVPNLTAGSTYTCTVAARNVAGWGPESAPTSNLHPIGPPPGADAPTAIPGDSIVQLTWDPMPDTPTHPVDGYIIYRDGMFGCQAVGAAATTCTVYGLVNGTTYYFQLQAYSSYDAGLISPPTAATPRRVPDAPTIGVAATSFESLLVSFTGPVDAPPSNGGAPIIDWRATCESSDGGDPGSATGDTSPIAVPGLTPDRNYTCTVAARNIAGWGPESDPTAPAMPYTIPVAPVLTSAVGADRSADLEWQPPATGEITGYRVYVNGTIRAIVGDAADLNATIFGLTNGTQYAFQVSSYHSGAESPLSNVLYATPRAVPGPPTIVSTTPNGQRAEVAYTPPEDSGGAPIDNYEIECFSTDGGASRSTTSPIPMPVTITNLTASHTYQCHARARNTVGWGPWSEPGDPFIAVSEPLAVTGLAVGRGDEQLFVTWDALASTPENPVTGYRIWKTGSPAVTVTGPSTASETLVGLTNGTTYPIQIQAYYDPDGAGGTPPTYGPLSDVVNGVPAGLPYAPNNVVANAIDTTIQVTFSMPVFNNGAEITSYQAECESPNGGTTRSGTNSTGSPVAVNNITVNRNYECRARVRNIVGWGPWSATSNTVAYPTPAVVTTTTTTYPTPYAYPYPYPYPYPTPAATSTTVGYGYPYPTPAPAPTTTYPYPYPTPYGYPTPPYVSPNPGGGALYDWFIVCSIIHGSMNWSGTILYQKPASVANAYMAAREAQNAALSCTATRM